MENRNHLEARLGTIDDVCQILNIKRPTGYRLYREGHFSDFVVKIGEKNLRFRMSGLMDYIEKGGGLERKAAA